MKMTEYENQSMGSKVGYCVLRILSLSLYKFDFVQTRKLLTSFFSIQMYSIFLQDWSQHL